MYSALACTWVEVKSPPQRLGPGDGFAVILTDPHTQPMGSGEGMSASSVTILISVFAFLVSLLSLFWRRQEARRANALPVLVTMLGEYRSPRFLEARDFVLHSLDEETYFPAEGFPPLDTDAGINVRTISYYLDNLGVLLEHGIADQGLVLDFLGGSANAVWMKLKPYIDGEQRRREDDEFYVVGQPSFQKHFGTLVARHFERRRIPSATHWNRVKTGLRLLGLVVLASGWVLANPQRFPWVGTLLSSRLTPALAAWEDIRRGKTVPADQPGLAEIVDVLESDNSLLRPGGKEPVSAYLGRNVGLLSALGVESIREIGDWGRAQQVVPGIAEFRPRISKLEILTSGNLVIQVALEDDMAACLEERNRAAPLFKWSAGVFLGGVTLELILLAIDVVDRRLTNTAGVARGLEERLRRRVRRLVGGRKKN